MVLQQYGHGNHEDGPGSLYECGGAKVLVPPNRIHIRNLFSDQHYHLYVKYGVTLALLQGEEKNIDIWKSIYCKMQNTRVGFSDFDKFDKLFNKIYSRGYDETSVIPVDNNFQILDGSHRLASLAALNLSPCVEVLSSPSHEYNKRWFEGNGFTPEDIGLIEEVKKEFFREKCKFENDTQLGFIWGSTISELGGSWGKVIDEVGESNLTNFYVRNFGAILQEVIHLAYLGDGIDSSTLLEKSNWIMERSNGLLGVFSLNNCSEDNINKIKSRVRSVIRGELSEYKFDSIIHTVDEAHPRSNKIRLELSKRIKNMNALLYI